MGRLLAASIILLFIFTATAALTTPTWRISLAEDNSASATEHISLKDPVGDDHGGGSITYPLNPVFVEGAFDLLGLEIYVYEHTIIFEVTLADLGGNPWNGTNGFSLQFVQIYLFDLNDPTGDNYTYGLRINTYPGWKYAVLVAPGFDPPAVPTGQATAIYAAGNQLIADQTDPSKIYSIALDNIDNIIVRINPEIIPEIDFSSTSWAMLVCMTGYDSFKEYRVRGINTTSTEWLFGGAPREAVIANVAPRIIDVLAPTSEQQYTYLSSYDPAEGRLAVFPALASNGTLLELPTQPTTTTTTPPHTTTTTTAMTKTTTTAQPITTTSTTRTDSSSTTVITTTTTLAESPTRIPSEGVSQVLVISLTAAAVIIVVAVAVMVLKTRRHYGS